jgi:hypothetical protein
MDLHTYTRELLDKHLLPELKEIAQGLGITPDGNRTRRETWVAALVGQPFPVFQSLDVQHQEPIEQAAENPPGVVENAIELPTENSIDVDRAQEPTENSPGVDHAQDEIEFPDLESALAEIARLREQNEKLLNLARSQAEKIRQAKDISPVEKPSFKRVNVLAQAACMNVSKALTGGWLLTMGQKLKRGFKKLKDIWELLIADEWNLTDLFCPPPKEPVYIAPIFAPIHSKYSAIPFSDDGLIDTWSLGVNAVSSGRAPPAGGDAM